jgi:hypothetical protein
MKRVADESSYIYFCQVKTQILSNIVNIGKTFDTYVLFYSTVSLEIKIQE